jgi:hypothetical protein
MKINPEYEIAWEKLRLPNEANEDEDDEGYSEDEEPKFQSLANIMNPAMQNPFYQLKSFNFWTGHTNFYLSKNIILIMSKAPGVESLEIVSPYRFHISIGHRFVQREVMAEFESLVTEYLLEHEKNIRHEQHS